MTPPLGNGLGNSPVFQGIVGGSRTFHAFRVAGDDYAEVGSFALGASGDIDYTLMLWVKAVIASNNQKIFVSYGAGLLRQVLSIGMEAGNVWVVHFTEDNQHVAPYSDGVWQHVAVAYSAATSTDEVYINGVSQDTNVLSGDLDLQTTAPLRIGDASFGGLGATADILGVRLFRARLTQPQIAAEMLSPFGLITASRVSSYPILPGFGQVLIDDGGGNDGVLGSTAGIDANDPTWVGPFTSLVAAGPQ